MLVTPNQKPNFQTENKAYISLICPFPTLKSDGSVQYAGADADADADVEVEFAVYAGGPAQNVGAKLGCWW